MGKTLDFKFIMKGITEEKVNKFWDELNQCQAHPEASISKKAEYIMDYVNKSILDYTARIEETNDKIILYITEKTLLKPNKDGVVN